MMEEIRGDIRAIIEVVVPMREEVTEMKLIIDTDIPIMKADIKAIKAALKPPTNKLPVTRKTLRT